MSSPSERFECHWRPSRQLLVAYLVVLGLALLAIALLDAPWWVRLAALLAVLGQAAWALPRDILLTSGRAWRGLRRDGDGWQLWRPTGGWQAIQLRPDSLALPQLVVLRYRRPGQWFSRGLCIPADALPADIHRRLRLRLKFSRQRWKAPG